VTVKYGDFGNKTLYARYDVETEAGMASTSKMDALVRQETMYRSMGVKNICPRCKQQCAVFLGDSEGEHWCLGCQVLADPEGLR